MAMSKYTDVFEKARTVVKGQKYAEDWDKFIREKCPLKTLMGASGFEPSAAKAVDSLRKKVKDETPTTGKTGETIYAASVNSASTGSTKERAAAMKMLKHVYHIAKSGSQDVWLYSPPKDYSTWVFDELTGDAATVKNKLSKDDEIFSMDQMKWMREGLAISLKAVEDARMKVNISRLDRALAGFGGLGILLQQATKKIVKRWFLDGDCDDDDMQDALSKLSDGLKKIAVACRSNSVVFTDYPNWRSQREKYFGGAIRGGEGGGFPVIYIEGAFTRLTGNSGKQWLCVETIVHEFSHHEVSTRDHRYDHAGLKPNKTTFPYSKAIENADSWGYFVMDLAGQLSKADFEKVWK